MRDQGTWLGMDNSKPIAKISNLEAGDTADVYIPFEVDYDGAKIYVFEKDTVDFQHKKYSDKLHRESISMLMSVVERNFMERTRYGDDLYDADVVGVIGRIPLEGAA